ncbi:hypothetical protein [Nitrospirillum viridazoti]|uniref:hypothetical protein n=1 Tax=Nitrospirillum viridazoti TaxID=3144925 RepID=UPI00110FE3F2|nr:hypothetical protein [Nitrospirillum amazonense]
MTSDHSRAVTKGKLLFRPTYPPAWYDMHLSGYNMADYTIQHSIEGQMEEVDIQVTMDGLMKKTSESISASLRHYWPSKNNDNSGNALHEGNIIAHLGHACIMKGWAIYQQAARHDTRGWLDLLAYEPNHQIQLRVEAKRFIKSVSYQGLLTDIDKINSFRLNHADNPQSKILSPSITVGLIAVVTHYKTVAEWWLENNDAIAGDTARHRLARHLVDHENGAGGTARALRFDCWYGEQKGTGWLLYAWHAVPSAVLAETAGAA